MREWTEKHIEEICMRLIKKHLSGSANVNVAETDENNVNDENEGGTTNETE